jgi:hypothetical protein
LIDSLYVNKIDLVIMESVSSKTTDFKTLEAVKSSLPLQSVSLKLILIFTPDVRSAAKRNTKPLPA